MINEFHRSIGGRLVRSAVCIAFTAALATAAVAQTAATFAAGQPKAIDIPAGNLRDALELVARQTGVELLFDSQQLRGLRTPGLHGTLTTAQAVQELLKGTRLELSIDPGTGAMMIGESARTSAPTASGSPNRREGSSMLRMAENGSTAAGNGYSDPPAQGVATESGAAPDGADESASRSQVVTQLDEVLVSARPLSQGAVANGVDALGNRSILDTPLQLNVISAEALKDVQIRSLDNLTKLDPGATIRTSDTQEGGSFIHIRGFDVGTIYLDGQPGLTGGNVRVAQPIEFFDSVQVVKGASSFLYGYSAPGGILNYISKQPTREPFAEATVGFSSPGNYYAHFDGSIANTDGSMGLRLNLIGENGRVETYNVKTRNFGASLNFGAELTPSTRLRVDAIYYDRHLYDAVTGLFLMYDAAEGLPKPFVGNRHLARSDSTYRSNIRSLTTTLIQELGSDWVFRLNAGVSSVMADYIQTELDPVNPQGDYESYLYGAGLTVTDTVAAQSLLKGKFSTGRLTHHVAVGAALNDYDSDYGLLPNGENGLFVQNGSGNFYTREGAIFTPYAGDRFKRSVTYKGQRASESSLFASDLVELNERFAALVGLRKIFLKVHDFDIDGSTLGLNETSPVSPTYGLIFKPRSNLSLYGTYSQSLSAGDRAPDYAVNDDTIIEAIKTQQYELGAKAEYGPLFLTGALFRIKQPYTYCLTDSGTADVPGCFFSQRGLQSHDGAELTISGKLTDSLSGVVGGQYLDARIINDPLLEGKQPIAVPRANFTAYLSYKVPGVPGLSANVGAQHVSSWFIDSLNASELDAFTTVDVGASYAFEAGGRAWSVRGRVDNVLQEKFFYPRQGLEIGMPRTLRISLTSSF